jgi:hypothetical protein
MRSFCANERGLTKEGPGSTSPGQVGAVQQGESKNGTKEHSITFLERCDVGSTVKAMMRLLVRRRTRQTRERIGAEWYM